MLSVVNNKLVKDSVEVPVKYNNTTTFYVQLGTSTYKTVFKVVGSLQEAVKLYNLVKVNPGQKKRLYMPLSKTVLDKCSL